MGSAYLPPAHPRQIFIGNRDAEGLESILNLAVAINADALHFGELLRKNGMAPVKAITQYVHRLFPEVGADLDAGNGGEVLLSTGFQELFEALDRIVIGKR